MYGKITCNYKCRVVPQAILAVYPSVNPLTADVGCIQHGNWRETLCNLKVNNFCVTQKDV